MNHEAQSRLPEWVSNPLVRVAAGAVALGGSVAGCGGDDGGGVDPGFTPNPAHTLTVEPTATNTPIIEATPTAEPTVTPTAVPTERVQDVPCVILPQELCDSGELIEFTSDTGLKLKMIGFNLPVGTPVYSPRDGAVALGAQVLNGVNGNFLIIADPKTPTNSGIFFGDLSFPVSIDSVIKQGDQIGSIQDTGIRSFDKYNLLFRPNTVVNGAAATDEQVLEQLFPGILDQSPVSLIGITPSTPQGGAPVYQNSSGK